MFFRVWKKIGLVILSMGLMVLLLEIYVDNFDIIFIVNICDIICDMKIEGGSGDGISNVILIGINGKVCLDYIILKNVKVMINFKFKMVLCLLSLVLLKIIISGSVSMLMMVIKNLFFGDGSVENIGVVIFCIVILNIFFVINLFIDI